MGPEPERPAVDLVETLLVPLWRSRGWIALMAVLGLAAGIFHAAIQPNSYDSIGKLLARPGAREEGSAEARVVGSGRVEILSGREAVSNELHLLSNPKVYEKVVRRVGAERILAPYDPRSAGGGYGAATSALHAFQAAWFRLLAGGRSAGGHAPDGCEGCVAAATQVLMRSLFLRSETGSSVISIVCTTSSPRLSADLVDAFIAEAVAHHQEVFASDSSLAFLEEQVAAAMAARARADEQLSDFRVQCGFYDAEAQRGHLLTDLHTLRAQLDEDLARLATLTALESLLQEEIAKEDERQRVPVERTVLMNPARTRIEQRIFDLRIELLGLQGKRDRTTAQLEAERASLEQQLAKAQEELERTQEFLDPGTMLQDLPNPRYARLRERLDVAHEERIALQSGSRKREERLAQAQRSLVELERCGPTLNLLETEARQASQRLDQFLEAREQVGLMDLLDSVNLINLRPLQYATLPFQKSGPRRGRSVLLGLALGLMGGFGLALVRPSLDRRLRGPADVRRLLRAPVLGVLPELRLPVERVPRARPPGVRR